MVPIGRYEILEELGRGGFATVYKARDSQLNRLVALKVLHESWSNDPDFVRRFRQEAETVANLRHPHIVVVHDVGEIDRRLFIAMEFLSGEDLRRWLARRKAPLAVSETLAILDPVAGALDYAHKQGVVHRDIKPGNIMIHVKGDSREMVLTDFGLVKAMESSVALTSAGQILGSPEYMAPEQADPNRRDEIGPHTDN
jgi:serine/threonine protein kinase